MTYLEKARLVGSWRRNYLGYLVALAALFAALLASTALRPFGPVAAYLPPVLLLPVCAWYGGVGPALLFQLCSAVLIFGFVAGSRPIARVTAAQIYPLLGFLITGKLALFLSVYVRWARDLKSAAVTLKLLASATNDVLWEWDPAADHVSLTGNLNTLLGEPGKTNEQSSRWWQQFIHLDDDGTAWRDLNTVIAGTANSFTAEYRLRKADHSYAIVRTRGTILRDRSGKSTKVIGGISDITSAREAQDRLAYQAAHDAVTGLHTRLVFRDRLENIISVTAEGRLAAVLFLDLDRFKTVNDSFGHAVGDKLLRAVAKRIELSLMPDEVAARFGGDEFTILSFPISDSSDAIRAAERIQQSLATPFELEGHTVVVTASIGIALAGRDSFPEEVLRHADVAMYRAKAQGRAGSELFESLLDAPRMNLVQLESDIRKGIGDREFRIFYQPIVNLEMGTIIGLEALVRWQHPQRGLLLPAEFVPIAEESGLIRPLGTWILRTVCEQMNHWRTGSPEARNIYVSVNIAERQFVDPELPDILGAALEGADLPGDILVLELTENMILGDSLDAAKRMHALREIGIRFALDDFGKGRSSLARLHELPISILKLDCAFTHAITEGRPMMADAIIGLGQRLHLDVTAECVETREHYEHLHNLGCTAAQGAFFAPAMHAESVLSLLRAQKRWGLEYRQSSGT